MSARFHIPSLDGVRAGAVLTVFIGHGALIGGPWPGHLGVTVFFFLSGYLITTLLRMEHERCGDISLRRFYMRRLLRITPPALVSILLCVLVGLLGWPSEMTAGGILAAVFNVTNYYMIWHNSYAGLPPESSMLWSLAVEEHFYLLFPAVVLFCFRRRMSYRTIAGALLLAIAIAPLWRLYLFWNGATFFRLYTATDTRFDGLLAGAVFALVCNPALDDAPPFNLDKDLLCRRLLPAAIAIVAILGIVPRAVRITIADTPIYACLSLVFWVIVKFPDGLLGRVLNHRIVVHIGVLSYSLYLVHRLIIALLSKAVSSPWLSDLLALLVSLAVAQAIYMFVERPLTKVRRYFERQPVTL